MTGSTVTGASRRAHLEAWLQQTCAWAGVETPRLPEGRTTLVCAQDAALPVVLAWTPDASAVTVTLDPWSATFEATDDDLREALDLVAAALFGLCRQRLVVVRGVVAGGCLEVYCAERWKMHARWGRRAPWWRRSSEATLRNARQPPFVLAEALGVPRAPWAGVSRHAERTEADPEEIAIDGELDLHTFAPREVGALLEAYIEVCRSRGLTQLRVVHGKGRGQLRRSVHAVLERHPAVRSFRLGSLGEGSWGATLVDLEPPSRG